MLHLAGRVAEEVRPGRAGRADDQGGAASRQDVAHHRSRVGELGHRQEDHVGGVREVRVVAVHTVPVVQVGRDRDPQLQQLGVEVAGEVGDRHVDVPRPPDRGKVEVAGQALPGRGARVVQREPAPVGTDQQHAAPGALGHGLPREVDPARGEVGPDQRALGVVADEVDQPGAKAEGVAAERDPAAGVADAVDHRGHAVGVGVRKRQLGHVHRRVDARAPGHDDVVRHRVS